GRPDGDRAAAAGHRHRRGVHPGCDGDVRRDRARSAQRTVPGPTESGRGRLPPGGPADHPDEPTRRVRLRRRGGPHLPAGDPRGRHRVCRGAGRRALAGRPGAVSRRGDGRGGDHLTESTPAAACYAYGQPRIGAVVGVHTITVTDETFTEKVLHSDKPVLVDFWAEWCAPCRMVAPVLDEIAAAHQDEITVAKVNIDENPKVAQQYQIMAIPNMSVFKGGELVKSIVGAKPKSALLADLSEWIS